MVAKLGAENCLMEWSLRPGKTYADPFNDVELDAGFTDPPHGPSVQETESLLREFHVPGGQLEPTPPRGGQGGMARRGALSARRFHRHEPAVAHGPGRAILQQARRGRAVDAEVVPSSHARLVAAFPLRATVKSVEPVLDSRATACIMFF